MRTETKTWEVDYRMFDVGERVRRQDTTRAFLFPPGVHVVTRCEPPRFVNDEALVWIEGYEVAYPTAYLIGAEEDAGDG